MSVQRFELVGTVTGPAMEQRPEGDWVDYDDHAAALAAKDERIEELEGERDALRHSESLIQADLGMFKTDCSTPTFELARNAVKWIEELEDACRAVRETCSADPQAGRERFSPKQWAAIVKCLAALHPTAREGGE